MGYPHQIQIALISRDESLRRTCHETLTALSIPHQDLQIAAPDELVPAADVYIWDGAQRTQAAGIHLVAVTREEARNVLDALAFPAVTLLLKPVNPDALRTLLEQAAGHAAHDGRIRHDRDAILDSLIETTLRLQECDQDRMNFLARTVHDFRTPLTAVNGYCGLLLSGQLGALTTPQEEVLGRTLHSVRRLGRLATALFQWSSGARAGMRSQIREGDIQEVCRQALHEIRPLADEKNISVELELEPPAQPLCFDPSQMEQLLVNLLENSCKFTLRGGYIRVRGFSDFWERRAALFGRDGVLLERRRDASRHPNAFRLEVSDNGMGIQPEHLPTIFQEYTSYGGGSDRSGSGLGLAICKRILAEHGGCISAESGSQGVTFICMLPFIQPAGGEPRHTIRGGIHLVPETVGKEVA